MGDDALLLLPLPPGEGRGEGPGLKSSVSGASTAAQAGDRACGFPHPGPLPEGEGETSPWQDAVHAAALLAVDSIGTGGASLRAGHGPVRARWLALLRGLLPDGAPWRKVPLTIADGRLLGGLDLAATLAAGRPVAERGLLAEAAGGVLLLPMAERTPAGLAARLALALDAGTLALVALDEGATENERTSSALLDRLAFHVQLAHVGVREPEGDAPTPQQVAAARLRLPGVRAGDAILQALCGTAAALGVASVRAPLLALRAARAAAALAGRDEVAQEDAALACRLVLAPRATVLPVQDTPDDPQAEAQDDPAPQQPKPDGNSDAETDDAPAPGAMDDMLLQAARAAIPAGLLAMLQARALRQPARAAGVSGAPQAGRRGRPAGVRAGDPRGEERLNLIETLRAAAPWQRIRGAAEGRLQIRRGDFRVTRCVQRAETTTIFVVDASGSSALNRLAEAKGAVELLLAECYVRRDRVAVLAFRGAGAQLLLPPTRSLVRAKRGLAALPGGGGTPLAAGLDAGFLLADAVRRRGGTPSLVLLTDGRGNVARDGRGGRDRAEADAMQAARVIRLAGVAALLVDTSPRPAPAARRLADAMAARYLPLPYANAAALSLAVTGAGRG
jgi:magnesium chelatase subunit D